MRKSETLTIRIEGDLKREVAAAAKADDRSVTSLVCHLLRQHLRVKPRTRTRKE